MHSRAMLSRLSEPYFAKKFVTLTPRFLWAAGYSWAMSTVYVSTSQLYVLSKISSSSSRSGLMLRVSDSEARMAARSNRRPSALGGCIWSTVPRKSVENSLKLAMGLWGLNARGGLDTGLENWLELGRRSGLKRWLGLVSGSFTHLDGGRWLIKYRILFCYVIQWRKEKK